MCLGPDFPPRVCREGPAPLLVAAHLLKGSCLLYKAGVAGAKWREAGQLESTIHQLPTRGLEKCHLSLNKEGKSGRETTATSQEPAHSFAIVLALVAGLLQIQQEYERNSSVQFAYSNGRQR